ncbi:hypothetical protein OUZ56_021650 [Daphnia magna]|uniref:Uncharacterized protein n=1 Tax=Daphnia magna TaxID=35525 RepID=A0ABR0AU35_9CRUS|nr:hypothetical protein OUZ56_021650 [Daphnia magna]
MHVGIAGSILSNHMAIAINMYHTMDATTPGQKGIKNLFNGTEYMERCTKLLNHAFDVLNARFSKEGIIVLN